MERQPEFDGTGERRPRLFGGLGQRPPLVTHGRPEGSVIHCRSQADWDDCVQLPRRGEARWR